MKEGRRRAGSNAEDADHGTVTRRPSLPDFGVATPSEDEEETLSEYVQPMHVHSEPSG